MDHVAAAFGLASLDGMIEWGAPDLLPLLSGDDELWESDEDFEVDFESFLAEGVMDDDGDF